MWRVMRDAALLAAFGAGLLGGGAVQAQIKVGQSAGFSGPVAAGVKEITDGARLYLDAVNKAGGVGGQAIELVSLDDRFEPLFDDERFPFFAVSCCISSGFCAGQMKLISVCPSCIRSTSSALGSRTLNTMSDAAHSAAAPSTTSAPAGRTTTTAGKSAGCATRAT